MPRIFSLPIRARDRASQLTANCHPIFSIWFGNCRIQAVSAGEYVNSVLPAPTASEGVEKFVQQLAAEQNTDAAAVEREFFRTMRSTSLLKRFARPEEVAALVPFVCSPLSLATNGASLRVDGG